MVVDTHAHLTDEKLADDAAGVIDRAVAAGVDWLVTVASDGQDSEQTVALANRFDRVYATVGIHPHAAQSATEASLARIRELASDPRVVAIGETGLDFYYDNAPKDTQYAAFKGQLELGRDLDLPVVVHAREADEEVARLLLEVGWKKGVLHCFSSGERLLDLALSLDWYVSFAGMITFAKWEGHDLLRRVPLERLLVETDSPYLAPVPFRGRTNEPAYVRQVAEKAAEIRGEDPEILMAATSSNACAFYGVVR